MDESAEHRAGPLIAREPHEEMTVDLPVLAIRRAEGDGALLSHKLTDDEKALFKEMDAATATLPEDTDLSENHRVVAAIGSKYGLSRHQSVAFWTRTTFMVFEP